MSDGERWPRRASRGRGPHSLRSIASIGPRGAVASWVPLADLPGWRDVRSAVHHYGVDEVFTRAARVPGPPAPPDYPSIGSLIPSRRAVSSAVSYPASAWRATPIPGSVVSTRATRSRARGVPPTTVTWPACSDVPIPTAPPRLEATHDGP